MTDSMDEVEVTDGTNQKGDRSIPPSRRTLEQNADIRFLGRILGDVIRDYGGEALFRQTEHIRAAFVNRYRGLTPKEPTDLGLVALSLDETLAFTRGFMCFSLLANLA